MKLTTTCPVSVAVEYTGFAAAGSTCLLAMFSILSVLQLTMVVSKDRVLLPYSIVLTAKLILALLSSELMVLFANTGCIFVSLICPSLFAAILSIIASALFALQTDDRENDFNVTRGESFYIQVNIYWLNFKKTKMIIKSKR